MVQEISRANAEVSLNCAGFRISCAINKPGDSRVNKRAGTHRARLDGGIQHRAVESIIADGSRSFSESDDLRVRSRITGADHRVSSSSDDLAFQDNDCAHRHLPGLTSKVRLGKGRSHESFINRIHVRLLYDETSADVTSSLTGVSINLSGAFIDCTNESLG